MLSEVERNVVAMMKEADIAGSALVRPAQSLEEVGTDWFGNTDPEIEEEDDPHLTGALIVASILGES